MRPSKKRSSLRAFDQTTLVSSSWTSENGGSSSSCSTAPPSWKRSRDETPAFATPHDGGSVELDVPERRLVVEHDHAAPGELEKLGASHVELLPHGDTAVHEDRTERLGRGVGAVEVGPREPVEGPELRLQDFRP